MKNLVKTVKSPMPEMVMVNTVPSLISNDFEGVTTRTPVRRAEWLEAQGTQIDLGNEIVCSIKELMAVRKNDLGLTNHGEHKGTYYLERRMVTSIRQPFALVRLRSTATASS